MRCREKIKATHKKSEKCPYPLRGKLMTLVCHISQTKCKKEKVTGN